MGEKHPYEEAIEFLLAHVARHGDKQAQERAEYHLNRIRAVRERQEGSDNAAGDQAAGQPA